MSASPFAFYRGAAYVMASDLSGSPQSGIRVQLCGDAHLANFGAFASPERQLLFDLNDFDETLPGPWEWDVKRLAASVAVAGRENGFKAKRRIAMVRELVGEYREAMRRFATMKTLDVWYARARVSDLQKLARSQGSERQSRRLEKTVAKGRRKDSARAFAKLAVSGNGEPRIRADPPLIVPIADLVDGSGAMRLELSARRILESYLGSLSGDRSRLLERFRYVDLARKVVGVGSVGTRCWVILLLGRDSSDPLFLQAKEAPHSVLERFAGKSAFSNQGQRVVEGQRLMQAAGDIFLGWLRQPLGLEDLKPRDLYVRQLWDSKISADISAMRPSDMALYAQVVRVDARARARAVRRRDRDRELSRFLRCLRPRNRGFRRGLCRPERARPRRARRCHRNRTRAGRRGALSSGGRFQSSNPRDDGSPGWTAVSCRRQPQPGSPAT